MCAESFSHAASEQAIIAERPNDTSDYIFCIYFQKEDLT